ncbi:hypothetical protein ES705_37588 [subsurface metagenome]
MTCPGGCIGGGGQPRMTTDEIRKARIQAIYKEDEGRELRKSHDNPAVKALYEEFLGKPLGEKSHHLLHTKYFNKKDEKVLLSQCLKNRIKKKKNIDCLRERKNSSNLKGKS